MVPEDDCRVLWTPLYIGLIKKTFQVVYFGTIPMLHEDHPCLSANKTYSGALTENKTKHEPPGPHPMNVDKTLQSREGT